MVLFPFVVSATEAAGSYRQHVPDPIHFHSADRVTIQQIGCWDPKSAFEFRAAGRTVPAIAGGLAKD